MFSAFVLLHNNISTNPISQYNIISIEEKEQ